MRVINNITVSCKAVDTEEYGDGRENHPRAHLRCAG
jgi:hypothetical protein